MTRALLLALALVVGLGAADARAQTIGYAQAIDILADACGNDIARSCKSARLANDGITNCLRQHESSISGQCSTSLTRVRQSLAAREEAQNSAERICNRDIQRLCNLVQPGRGHILRCLLKAEPSVSAACNQAITNAGWR